MTGEERTQPASMSGPHAPEPSNSLRDAAASPPVQPGDWVQVYGQVTGTARIHPDDVQVEFFSHNAQFDVQVRRDRVVRVAPPKGLAYRCNALYRLPKTTSDELVRCHRHERHGDEHVAAACDGSVWAWGDDKTVGYMEDR